MSDCQFTDKEISIFIDRYKNKKGWLNTRYVRRRNEKASEVRKLMKLVVVQEVAFDNKIDLENEKYEICFNLDEKQKILDELEDVTKRSLSQSSDILNREKLEILPKEFFQILDTTKDVSTFNEILFNVRIVYEAFSKHQNGEEFKDFNFMYTFDHLLKKQSQRINDDHKKLLLTQVYTLIDMHHALRVGWEEIKHITTISTHNELFINLFIGQQLEVLILMRHLEQQQIQLQHRSDTRNMLKIIKLKKYLANQELGDEHILDVIKDFDEASRALSVYDIPSKYEDILSHIKTALGKSDNPRVRKALSDWRESGDPVFKLFGTMSRWYADNPEARPRE